MKEKIEQNEAFLSYLEERVKHHCDSGSKPEEALQKARLEAITKFKLKNMHTCRAWLSRLKDSKKYEGKYSSRANALQKQPKPKPAPVVEKAAAEAASVAS